ncbi:methyl-accepting chemotaxis protein [Bacillus sp. JJ722]|uniref:methyl-accepting chemotaxis protein n=1 Tax=Bacillus sp. JJ722 TaxID=3122973 RepID=UPI002FFE829B
MKKKKHGLKLKLGTKINLMVLGIIVFLSSVLGIVAIREVTAGIKEFAVEKAKGDLHIAYRYIDSKYAGDWEIKDGKLYKGSTVFNENHEIVDEIAADTGDTIIIYQDNIGIATNGMHNGKRLIGTEVSPEIEELVLKEGKHYYGDITIYDNTYQTAYMPIKDKNGKNIGIIYVGTSQNIIDKTISSFVQDFVIVLIAISIISSIIVLIFSRRLKKRLRKISNALEKAGNGDFRTEIVDQTGDELSDLSNSYNLMKTNLSNMIHKVKETAEQVAASSEELTAGSEQTSKASEQITDAIQQVVNGTDTQLVMVEEGSKGFDEMAVGMKNIAESYSIISEASAQSSERAKRGAEFVETSVEQINAIQHSVHKSSEMLMLLDKRSHQIGEITKVITDIANETNLLALNAAIEAARAGEHGKGFAVVADEVRKLAEQSQHSSTQIADFVNEINENMLLSNQAMDQVKKDVQNGLGVVGKTQESFKEILCSTEKMEDRIDEMAATTKQISASAREIATTVSGIRNISKEASLHSQSVAAATEEQFASMEEINVSATALSKMATNLQELVNDFKV